MSILLVFIILLSFHVSLNSFFHCCWSCQGCLSLIKMPSNYLQVHVKCGLVYMDFEGRSDGRSIKSILGHVAPLKLVRNLQLLDNS